MDIITLSSYNKLYIGKYKSTYIHAPIRNYEIGGSELFGDEEFFTAPDIPEQKGWYDPDIVKKNLPTQYDLILVDGPNGRFGRGGFYKYLDWFNTDVPIIIDDVGRDAERILMEKVSETVGREYKILSDDVTGVI